ncbi:ParA family protein (plasmid) [Entomospira nematocerorum]|uniref:ParA family protein n=1 Tax=Entomospira nematocerorum TaxID=2719987 RepID=A0A968GIE5_9SPIO|nr:ParA family protein [Entomospira nematocera]NIZ47691.1 ParA family protein [Entomospira nematocera]WDI34666.1 ParA family protein [Entomospira nematocera]
MIIAITNVKGGVGKSTLSIHFAYIFSSILDYKRVLLLDADKQASVWTWSQIRADNESLSIIRCQPLGKQGVRPLLLREREDNDVVIVDVGGEDSTVTRAVAATADIVIIPSQISSMDHSGNKVIIRLAEEAQSYNPDMQTCMVLNRISTTTKEVDEIDELKELYPSWILWPQHMKNNRYAVIHDRVAFRRTTLEGFTVFDQIEESSTDWKAQYDIAKTLHGIMMICEYNELASMIYDKFLQPFVLRQSKEEMKYIKRYGDM